MAKFKGSERSKNKGVRLYPSEIVAIKRLAKAWGLSESRAIALLISQVDPEVSPERDISASVSAIASDLRRIESRLAKIEEFLVSGEGSPAREKPPQVGAEGQALAEVAPEDGSATEETQTPGQDFARLKKLVVEAFEMTRIGPLGQFVDGKRTEPELKRVLDTIMAMESDGLVQVDSRDVHASLILRLCLLYTFRYGGEKVLSEEDVCERVRGMGFTLWPADYDNALTRLSRDSSVSSDPTTLDFLQERSPYESGENS